MANNFFDLTQREQLELQTFLKALRSGAQGGQPVVLGSRQVQFLHSSLHTMIGGQVPEIS